MTNASKSIALISATFIAFGYFMIFIVVTLINDDRRLNEHRTECENKHGTYMNGFCLNVSHIPMEGDKK